MSRETLTAGIREPSLGYFGKIPAADDFVSLGLPRAFVDVWDQWLRKAFTHSREQLGEQWLDCYLTSPMWRFALSSGICGSAPWTGVLIPSVDRVGRYFPFTLAAKLSPGISVLLVFTSAEHWFEKVEKLALFALDDTFELNTFQQRLQILGTPEVDISAQAVDLKASSPEPNQDVALHFGLSSTAQLVPDWPKLTAHLLGEFLPGYSLWWTQGSARTEHRVEPSLVVCQGLPSRSKASAMMDGKWEQRGWHSYRLFTQSLSENTGSVQPTPAPKPVIRWSSACRTHIGKVRSVNEDACLELPDRRLWVVADGMGGHVDGSIASQQVIDSLQDIGAPRNLEDFVAQAKGQLERANMALRERATHSPTACLAGSTVVVLLALDDQVACLWAGDSRAYLYSNEELTLLTRDHKLVDELVRGGLIAREDVASHPDADAITRAVGGGNELQLDVVKRKVKDNDLFLLCSDGLTKELREKEILQVLLDSHSEESICQLLVKQALEQGGQDNITVVAIRASKSGQTG